MKGWRAINGNGRTELSSPAHRVFALSREENSGRSGSAQRWIFGGRSHGRGSSVYRWSSNELEPLPTVRGICEVNDCCAARLGPSLSRTTWKRCWNQAASNLLRVAKMENSCYRGKLDTVRHETTRREFRTRIFARCDYVRDTSFRRSGPTWNVEFRKPNSLVRFSFFFLSKIFLSNIFPNSLFRFPFFSFRRYFYRIFSRRNKYK